VRAAPDERTSFITRSLTKVLTSRVVGQVPRTGIRGSEQCISGGGTPNRCAETDSHAIPQAFVLPSRWCHPCSSYCRPQCPRPFFLFAPRFFLCAYPSFPQRNFVSGSTRNDDRQLDRPTTSPVLSLRMRISFPRVDRWRHRIASKKSWPKRRGSVQLMTSASIWRPKSTISRGIFNSRGIFSDSAA
jgi:hypothetical protein